MYAEFVDEKIEKYAEAHTDQEPELLEKLNRETHLKVLKPRMLAGSYQGRLLAMLSKLIAPRYVLEIGTYTGYSALCWKEGLTKGGEVHTIDNNEELKAIQERYFEQGDKEKQIHLHVGTALEVIPKLNKDWDLVFLDADKENYINYYNLLVDDLKPGAVIIADNVLWSGKVTNPKENDNDTAALRAFNEIIQNDSRVSNVLIPVRDGITIIRKEG